MPWNTNRTVQSCRPSAVVVTWLPTIWKNVPWRQEEEIECEWYRRKGCRGSRYPHRLRPLAHMSQLCHLKESSYSKHRWQSASNRQRRCWNGYGRISQLWRRSYCIRAVAFFAWSTIASWGMPIGEFSYLEKLAEYCQKVNRWSFLTSEVRLLLLFGKRLCLRLLALQRTWRCSKVSSSVDGPQYSQLIDPIAHQTH